MTRSLGDFCMKKLVIGHPDVSETFVDLMPDEPTFLIVACDGFWDVVTDQQAVDLVRTYKGDKKSVANYLIDVAMKRGTTDNVTVLVGWLS